MLTLSPSQEQYPRLDHILTVKRHRHTLTLTLSKYYYYPIREVWAEEALLTLY